MRENQIGPWPERFCEERQRASTRLGALLTHCAEDAGPSPVVLRRAAMQALAEFERRSFWGRVVRPHKLKSMAWALGACGVVMLGQAFAWEWRKQHAAPAPPIALTTPTPTGAVPPKLQGDISVSPPRALETRPQPVARRASRAKTTLSRALPKPPEEPLATEASQVSRALELLDGDPQGALALLNNYHRRFPQGVLRGEATVAEINARLELGQKSEALALLDGFARNDFRNIPGSEEIRLLRAELLLNTSRYAEALPVFESYLSPTVSAQLRARALLGRAACRGRVGDNAGDRADLERYLREFPRGAQHAAARKALGLDQ